MRVSRRRFVQTTGAAGLSLLAGCGRLAGLQPARQTARVGWLTSVQIGAGPTLDVFRDALREHGYVDGQNVTIDMPAGEWSPERYPEMATDLVTRRVDIIVAAGGNPSARAAKNATDTIPIVLTGGADPVAAGLVASLARPGGNVTGVTGISSELSGKRLELLTQLLPGLTRVAVLWNPGVPDKAVEAQEVQFAAQALGGIHVVSLEMRMADDLEHVFTVAGREHVQALIILQDGVTRTHRVQIADLALSRRLPSMWEAREAIEAGGLMAYGSSPGENYRRAAAITVRLLEGARPADLPIERPMRFGMIVNLKTAQALGLTIPQHVLLQATDVIE